MVGHSEKAMEMDSKTEMQLIAMKNAMESEDALRGR